jgi:hypothetical protein
MNWSVTFAGQVTGMVAVTCTDCPGESVPFDGLKPTADGMLLVADQFRLPVLLELLLRVATQAQAEPLLVQLLVSKLLGLADSMSEGVVQLHDTVTEFPPCPAKVKVPFVQSLLGILIDTGTDGLAEVIVPLAGLKVTPLKLLDVDQLRLPCEP